MSRFYCTEKYTGKTFNGAIQRVGRFILNARTGEYLDDDLVRQAWRFLKKEIAIMRRKNDYETALHLWSKYNKDVCENGQVHSFPYWCRQRLKKD